MSSAMDDIGAVLAEIEQEAKKIECWSKHEGAVSEDPTACMYTGAGGDWVIIIVSFDIESQGFPKGSRGHDGAAKGKGMVIRLPRAMTMALAMLAEERCHPKEAVTS
jgi:hypothetical protein